MGKPSQARALSRLLDERDVLLLDGGLATELEFRGCDLSHPLWSARLLLSDPWTIAAVHREYLEVGADIVVAATYQASLQGFESQGLEPRAARQMLTSGVRIACAARDDFCASERRTAPHPRLVAASVGPFGAFLADGSEFRGNYGVGRDQLRGFHEERWALLADSGADLLACETVPDRVEAEVLVELVRETPGTEAWLGLSCRDAGHISDGTPIEELGELSKAAPNLVALGVNCTAPRFVPELIERLAAVVPEKAIVVYPNSGEVYDGVQRRWTGASDPIGFGEAARDWRARGARLLGGCCRTRPAHIAAMRAAL